MEDRKTTNISLILPAYNEEDNISEVVERSMSVFKEKKWNAEIIIINDGSIDRTEEEAESKCRKYSNVKLVNHRKNLGLSYALMSGLKEARADIIIFLCADLQSNPQEDIPKLVEGINEGYDVVCGWRQGRKEAKIVVSKIYHILSRLLFNIPIHDLNWIKAFRREAIEEIILRPGWHRYIIVLAAHHGYKIKEIKTNYYPRKFGKSKFGRRRVFKAFLDLLVVKFEISFLDKPMLFFGSIGLVSIALGIILATGLFIHKLMTGIGYRPLLNLISLLIILGVQFIVFGLLFEAFVSLSVRLKRIEEYLKKYLISKEPEF